MTITRDLQITASEFFGVVFAELAAEIKAAGYDAVEPEALTAGFTQVYASDNPALKATFEIVEYQEDRLYKAVRTSAGGTTTLIYEVTPKEDGITVSFTYETTPAKKKGFFSFFSDAIFLGRMTDKLYGIQRTVINEKEGFEEHKSKSPLLPDIRKAK